MDYSEKWGVSVENAVELALTDLKLTRDQVDVIVLEEPSKGFISAFGILPEYSGLGLGGKLLRHVLSSYEAMQAENVELAVSEANLPARRLYTAQQFVVIDHASLYYLTL